MRSLSGVPIPIEMHLALTARFGREYTLEHIVVFLLEREAARTPALVERKESACEVTRGAYAVRSR